MNTAISTTSTGAGFQPSTVCDGMFRGNLLPAKNLLSPEWFVRKTDEQTTILCIMAMLLVYSDINGVFLGTSNHLQIHSMTRKTK